MALGLGFMITAVVSDQPLWVMPAALSLMAAWIAIQLARDTEL